MVVERSDIWWAELNEPRGSEPGFRRPVLIVQAEAFNRSRLRTVLGLALTTNLRLAAAPGNVLLSASDSGLPRPSVVNVTQLMTVDRAFLSEYVGRVPPRLMARIDDGLRLVLGL
ncbi:MAG: type II toxin-antitoxin system PemK/MazF family toxin [Chloroflexi bacterium]|nr:type II toxin-antitoxin system PemK/MazF family toxin [Chloroflexota bacterium]